VTAWRSGYLLGVSTFGWRDDAYVRGLGLGTQPPEPSWGGMLSASRTYMEISPAMAIFPGAAIMLVVLGFNFLGDGLRDVLDPRLRSL